MDLIETADVSFRDKTVFIVRHAQGQHNVSPRFEFDPPLTEDGHKQVLSLFPGTLSVIAIHYSYVNRSRAEPRLRPSSMLTWLLCRRCDARCRRLLGFAE